MKVMAHIVWIVGVKENSRANAIKGVRAARLVLGDRLGSTLKRSQECVEQAEQTDRYILGSHDDPTTASEAARAAEKESNGVLLVEVSPNPQNDAGDAGELDVRIYHVRVDDDGKPVKKGGTLKDAILVEDLGDLHGSPFSWEAIATAMICLVTADGGPSTALTYARTYGLHDPESAWPEVIDILEQVFPSDPSGGHAPELVPDEAA